MCGTWSKLTVCAEFVDIKQNKYAYYMILYIETAEVVKTSPRER